MYVCIFVAFSLCSSLLRVCIFKNVCVCVCWCVCFMCCVCVCVLSVGVEEPGVGSNKTGPELRYCVSLYTTAL